MASKPFMPFYFADYEADTSHLTTLEHGAYFLLIKAYWQTGKPLPNDEKKLRSITRISKANWKKISKCLHEFFSVSDTHLSHKRIDYELLKFQKKSDMARVSAKNRWKNNDEKSDANALRTQCERNATVMRTQCYTDTDTDTEKEIKEVSNNNISSKRKKIRSEPAVIPQNVFESIVLVDGTEFLVDENVVGEFERCYPAVDVRSEIRKMRAYFFSTPQKRKTRRGIMKCMNSWLSNTQDSGHKNNFRNYAPRKLNNVEHNQLVLEKIIQEEELKQRQLQIQNNFIVEGEVNVKH